MTAIDKHPSAVTLSRWEDGDADLQGWEILGRATLHPQGYTGLLLAKAGEKAKVVYWDKKTGLFRSVQV